MNTLVTKLIDFNECHYILNVSFWNGNIGCDSPFFPGSCSDNIQTESDHFSASETKIWTGAFRSAGNKLIKYDQVHLDAQAMK